jgi:hypothetical protein
MNLEGDNKRRSCRLCSRQVVVCKQLLPRQAVLKDVQVPDN